MKWLKVKLAFQFAWKVCVWVIAYEPESHTSIQYGVKMPDGRTLILNARYRDPCPGFLPSLEAGDHDKCELCGGTADLHYRRVVPA